MFNSDIINCIHISHTSKKTLSAMIVQKSLLNLNEHLTSIFKSNF